MQFNDYRDKKQFQGSKKKARKKAFFDRELKRNEKKSHIDTINNATTMEEMAKVMGVKLK
jgi:hypothetical protein